MKTCIATRSGKHNRTQAPEPMHPANVGASSRRLKSVINIFKTALPLAVLLAAVPHRAVGQSPGGEVIGWGYANPRTPIPSGLNQVVAIAAGKVHSLALRSDGLVAVIGQDLPAQMTPPSSLTDAIAVESAHEVGGETSELSIALKADGTVVQWGKTGAQLPPVLDQVVGIAAGRYVRLALKADGTVVGWGEDVDDALQNVPGTISDIVAISAGMDHALGLKSDGTVVGWGANDNGKATPPYGLSGVMAVAAGQYASLVLKSNGTVVAWGSGQIVDYLPPGLSGVVAIAAGRRHALAVKSDGTVVAWGANDAGQSDSPAGNNYVAVAGGWYYVNTGGYSLALTACVWPPSIPISGTLSNAIIGQPYVAILRARSGQMPYTWSLRSGSLPPGLSLTPKTGVIKGTPTQIGTFNFTARCTGANRLYEELACSLTVVPPPPLTITTACPLPAATIGTFYNLTLGATGGQPPYTWMVSSGVLPAGLSLDGNSGLISGTPTNSNTYTFNIRCTDSAYNLASKSCSMTVSPPTLIAPRITSARPSGSRFLVCFTTVSGQTYSVEHRSSLTSGSWTTFTNNVPGNDGDCTVTDTGNSSGCFYRVRTQF
jgi:hypothetical protein